MENKETFDEQQVAHAPAAPRTMYVLCEEYEDDNAIREITILGVAEEKEYLQLLMKAKIEKDEYGYIASMGVKEAGEDYFSTNYEFGFVEYYILEQEVLTKEQVKDMLQTKEYSVGFTYPENFRNILISALSRIAESEEYGSIDLDRAVDAMLEDKAFQALAKKEWWVSYDSIPKSLFSLVEVDCCYFISHSLLDDPDYFQTIGAVPEFHCPDNLRDIMIDSIYDVSKVYHLPVTDSGYLADKYMRNSEFQALINERFQGVIHLEAGSVAHQDAAKICYDFALERAAFKDRLRKISLEQKINSAKLQQQKTVPSSSRVSPQR